MATFVTLYGDLLDQELGSSDRTVLFTTARRKAAINAGQKEFARLTSCFTKDGTITLVNAQSTYDLEATLTDFVKLDKAGIELALTDSSGNVTYVAGDSFPQTTVRDLNRYESGWRGASASTPSRWYVEPSGGAFYLGLYPKPDLSTAWASGTMTVPYVALPADMSGDTDVPYTASSNALVALTLYHQALVHYAAYQLEKLRRDVDAQKAQIAQFQKFVDDYKAAWRPIGGPRVRFARDYRRERSVTYDGTVTVKNGTGGWVDWHLG